MSLRASLPRSTSPTLRLLLPSQTSYSTLRFPSSSASSSSLPHRQLQHRYLSLSPALSRPPNSTSPVSINDDGLTPEERIRKRREDDIKANAEKDRIAQSENALKITSILDEGAGIMFERVQSDKNLPLPAELYWNPPRLWKSSPLRRLVARWQVAQLSRFAYDGTEAKPAFWRTVRFFLPFPRSDKAKQTDQEILASASESLKQYLNTKTTCSYSQLHRYATPPMLYEAISFANRNNSPARAQRKLDVNISQAKIISLCSYPLTATDPKHGFGHALVRFTYSMTMNQPNVSNSPTVQKTQTLLFERRSWAKEPNWKIRREIRASEQDLEVQHLVPDELLLEHMNPREWDGIRKIAGKPLKAKDA